MSVGALSIFGSPEPGKLVFRRSMSVVCVPSGRTAMAATCPVGRASPRHHSLALVSLVSGGAVRDMSSVTRLGLLLPSA